MSDGVVLKKLKKMGEPKPIKLCPGEVVIYPNEKAPHICVIGEYRPYVWIGGRGCFGTLEASQMARLIRDWHAVKTKRRRTGGRG